MNNPQLNEEFQEWLESLENIILSDGKEYAKELLARLYTEASYKGINLDSIQALVDKLKIDTIDIDVIINNGLANKKDNVKILGRGELKSKVKVSAHGFSKTAIAAIEAKGGEAELIKK